MAAFNSILLLVTQIFYLLVGVSSMTHKNIVITPTETDGTGKLPVVTGARQCGAPAKFLEWRMETGTIDFNISKDSNTVCRLSGDGIARRAEVDFIPSVDIPELSLSVKMLVKGTNIPQTLYSGPVVNSSVVGENVYTLKVFGGATNELIGKQITVPYQLFREDTFQIELCALAVFEIVK